LQHIPAVSVVEAELRPADERVEVALEAAVIDALVVEAV